MENYTISPQFNYLYLPEDSFNKIKKVGQKTDIIKKYIYISAILMLIIILLIIIAMFLIKYILNKFDKFILNAWIKPIIILLTIGNLLLYYLKMLIGSFLLFHCYHLRKKRCIVRCLFWIFVDKSMIQFYKIKNLITKYKKEFDYL